VGGKKFIYGNEKADWWKGIATDQECCPLDGCLWTVEIASPSLVLFWHFVKLMLLFLYFYVGRVLGNNK